MRGYNKTQTRQERAAWERTRVIAYAFAGGKKPIDQFMPFPWEKAPGMDIDAALREFERQGLIIDNAVKKMRQDG